MANCSKWKTLEYSRTQISRAGELIKKGQLSETDLVTSEQIIDNWRASHAFPMHIIYMHLRRLCQKRPDAIVAERLKRLESIKNKLRREPTMNLWSMQDLGGCRVIVPTINEKDKKIWNTLLINMASDIPGGCVQYLSRNDLVDVEREEYTQSILKYYSDKQILAQFINYIVIK